MKKIIRFLEIAFIGIMFVFLIIFVFTFGVAFILDIM